MLIGLEIPCLVQQWKVAPANQSPASHEEKSLILMFAISLLPNIKLTKLFLTLDDTSHWLPALYQSSDYSLVNKTMCANLPVAAGWVLIDHNAKKDKNTAFTVKTQWLPTPVSVSEEIKGAKWTWKNATWHDICMIRPQKSSYHCTGFLTSSLQNCKSHTVRSL